MIRGIVLIVIDCLRADHVSCYGYARATTPTIDALARHGIRWENAYSLSSWTKPSVTSLLTGLYPTEHGAYLGVKRSKGRSAATTDVLRSPTPTLAETFSRAGWRCGAFINNAQLSEFTRLNRGFDTYVPTAGKADRLISLFEQWQRRDLETPSFAYLHFLEAHWPYKPRRRHIQMFGGDRDKNRFRDFSARDYGKLRRSVSRGESSLSPDGLVEMVQMYDGAVRRLDGKVKLVANLLSELGRRDDTAILVTSDHGEEFMDHCALGHGHSLAEELIHVPLVAHIPGGPEHTVRSTPVSHVDLSATLADVAGIVHELPGRNIHSDDTDPSLVCAELAIRHRYMQTIRQGRWKLHRRYRFDTDNGLPDAGTSRRHWVATCPHRVSHELYDLASDPREQVNLANDRHYAATVNTMVDRLDRWWADSSTPTAHDEADDVEIDERVVARLRDLGYIE